MAINIKKLGALSLAGVSVLVVVGAVVAGGNEGEEPDHESPTDVVEETAPSPTERPRQDHEATTTSEGGPVEEPAKIAEEQEPEPHQSDLELPLRDVPAGAMAGDRLVILREDRTRPADGSETVELMETSHSGSLTSEGTIRFQSATELELADRALRSGIAALSLTEEAGRRGMICSQSRCIKVIPADSTPASNP